MRQQPGGRVNVSRRPNEAASATTVWLAQTTPKCKMLVLFSSLPFSREHTKKMSHEAYTTSQNAKSVKSWKNGKLTYPEHSHADGNTGVLFGCQCMICLTEPALRLRAASSRLYLDALGRHRLKKTDGELTLWQSSWSFGMALPARSERGYKSKSIDQRTRQVNDEEEHQGLAVDVCGRWYLLVRSKGRLDAILNPDLRLLRVLLLMYISQTGATSSVVGIFSRLSSFSRVFMAISALIRTSLLRLATCHSGV